MKRGSSITINNTVNQRIKKFFCDCFRSQVLKHKQTHPRLRTTLQEDAVMLEFVSVEPNCTPLLYSSVLKQWHIVIHAPYSDGVEHLFNSSVTQPGLAHAAHVICFLWVEDGDF